MTGPTFAAMRLQAGRCLLLSPTSRSACGSTQSGSSPCPLCAAEGQILCEHGRIIARSHRLQARTIDDWRHYLAVIQRKPGALRNGAPFAEVPDGFRQLQGYLLKRQGGDREMVEILSLTLQHDEQAVLCAVELALEAGVPTKMHVLNLLHRLIDGKTDKAKRVDIPKTLALKREPKADVARYDTTRRKEATRAS